MFADPVDVTGREGVLSLLEGVDDEILSTFQGGERKINPAGLVEEWVW